MPCCSLEASDQSTQAFKILSGSDIQFFEQQWSFLGDDA